MSKHTVVSLPGDGIGKTVLPEAIRVLDAVGFQANYVHGDIGWEFWCKEGNALPQRTIDLLAEHKLGLFGAITSKPNIEAQKELAPSLRDKDFVYYSPIVGLRQHFNLDICIRPCQTFVGNPLNFIQRDAAGEVIEPKVDAVIFRQNTEGLYSGVEWTNPPKQLRDAFATHKKMRHFADVPSEDLAISSRIFSRKACQRIARSAFEYAQEYGYKSVTICEKPNVIRETSGMLTQEAKKIAAEFAGIDLWETNIDAQMMWLTKNPADYGVIVAGNLFGDIVSDGFAGLVGGLGFACSANLGEEVAVFEPTHGSAPKYQDLQPSIVNPIAMILSTCMMLDHLGERDKAAHIRDAIAAVVVEGESQSYDMKRLRGSAKAIEQGAASTTQITDAIIAKL